MEKEIFTNPNNNNNNNNNNVPTLGAGTSTSSGVTVFAGSIPNNNNNHPSPPPPTYDQAVGNPTANVGPTSTYTSTGGWTTPNMPYTIPQSHTTTTTYTTYTTRGPPPPPTQPQPTAYAQPPVVIIQQQPMIPLGPEPVYLTCPACHIQKLTRIEHEPSPKTHLMAALLCLVGLWCCVCVPYCAGSCMNTHHYCGNCGKFLGTYGNTL
ncbi:uncharacterized protein ACRADG_010767 isoform 1-T1 [Cochliomyia hominivorax]